MIEESSGVSDDGDGKRHQRVTLHPAPAALGLQKAAREVLLGVEPFCQAVEL
jgi:hypothetical protein